MHWGRWIWICLFVLMTAQGECQENYVETIPVVISNQSTSLEVYAAEELSHYLDDYYLKHTFQVQQNIPTTGPAIYVGKHSNFPQFSDLYKARDLDNSESFIITNTTSNNQPIGLILGSDPQGTLYGVYSILEHLGYGFYLSFETSPQPTKEWFNTNKWNIHDEPLYHDRFVLNWHNFLSGCSTWDLKDWQKWISQLSKMRFNAIMVHAYGNNPMYTFTFNGETKPVGYLTTTQRGRDWGTQHVNDVRRLIGGEAVFEKMVFGSEAALVPENQRTEASKKLMQKVFAYAKSRGMDVIFALDVDTETVNSQNVILTLPESAHFQINDKWVANPDSEAGYHYYLAQIESLIKMYPQIDRLAVWFRGGRSSNLFGLWRTIKVEDFPEAWKKEYEERLQKHEAMKEDPDSPSLFAIAKIANAFRKALNELGHKNIELCSGSWNYGYLTASDVHFPPEIKMLPLDYGIVLDQERAAKPINAISSNREVSPIVWAHHDDHSYIGRPYKPFEDFASILNSYHTSGFGIIHWTTRPLDLYFKNIAHQVWQSSKNQSVEKTCHQMANDIFSVTTSKIMGEYFHHWINEGPIFGRETTDHFMDRPLPHPEKTMEGIRHRLEMLNSISLDLMNEAEREHWNYYQNLETFCLTYYQSQLAFEKAQELFKDDQWGKAREALNDCQPREVIEQYSKTIQYGEMNHGEKGILISLNLRWYPYVLALRQRLNMEPIRLNFQPTYHESLAQGAGHYTYFIDSEGKFWKGLGEKETGYKVEQNLPFQSTQKESEIEQSGIQAEQEITLPLNDLSPLSPGNKNIELRFSISEINTNKPLFVVSMQQEKGDNNRLLLEEAFYSNIKGTSDPRSFTVRIPLLLPKGKHDLQIKSLQKNVILCGMRIFPVQEE